MSDTWIKITLMVGLACGVALSVLQSADIKRLESQLEAVTDSHECRTIVAVRDGEPVGEMTICGYDLQFGMEAAPKEYHVAPTEEDKGKLLQKIEESANGGL
jgi:hypothetical protein